MFIHILDDHYSLSMMTSINDSHLSEYAMLSTYTLSANSKISNKSNINNNKPTNTSLESIPMKYQNIFQSLTEDDKEHEEEVIDKYVSRSNLTMSNSNIDNDHDDDVLLEQSFDSIPYLCRNN